MKVSNGLPFSFVENEETKALFEFIAPGLILPNHKAIGGRILMNKANTLQEVIKVELQQLLMDGKCKNKTTMGCSIYYIRRTTFGMGST